jgi:hypothetical protein
MLRKAIAIIIIFSLIFEQAGFAQVAPQLGVPAYLQNRAPVVDQFRPVHLRSISLNPDAENLNVLLDQGDSRKLQEQDIKDSAKKLMEYFQIGLRLPNSMFWVNLRPDAPNDIIDPYLENTDLGKVLLEADLQLKKDLARFTDPATPEGKQYWDQLYAKAESIYGSGDIEIPTVTRPWIVPGEIIIGEAKDSAYVYKATLKVMLEQDYLKDSVQFNFDDERMQQLNAYSSQLVRELIIPKLTRHVNASKQYAPLRQVFYSLILAQWYKARHAGTKGMYALQIDKKDLTGLTSQKAWSKNTCFKAYQKSFKDGEYSKEENVLGYNGMSVRRYVSGGINIESAALMSQKMNDSLMFVSQRVDPSGILPGLVSLIVSPGKIEVIKQIRESEIRRILWDNSPDRALITKYIEMHSEKLRDLARFIANGIVSSYIGFDALQEGLFRTVEDFKMKCDRPYIAFIPGGKDKSTDWIFRIARKFGMPPPAATAQIRSGAEIEDEIDGLKKTLLDNPDITDIVLVDDAAYSGTRIFEWVIEISNMAESINRDINIHILVPFMTNTAQATIERATASKAKVVVYDHKIIKTVYDLLQEVEEDRRAALAALLYRIYDVKPESIKEKTLAYLIDKEPEGPSVLETRPVKDDDGAKKIYGVFEGAVIDERGPYKLHLNTKIRFVPATPEPYKGSNELYAARIERLKADWPGRTMEPRDFVPPMAAAAFNDGGKAAQIKGILFSAMHEILGDTAFLLRNYQIAISEYNKSLESVGKTSTASRLYTKLSAANNRQIVAEAKKKITWQEALSIAQVYVRTPGNGADVFKNALEKSSLDPALIVARYFYENISAESIYKELRSAGVKISYIKKAKFKKDLIAAGYKRLKERIAMPHKGEKASFTRFIIGVSPMEYVVEFLKTFKYTGEERMIEFSFPAPGGGSLKIIIPASVRAKRDAWLNGMQDAERVGRWVDRRDGNTIRIVDYHPLPSLTFDSPGEAWDKKDEEEGIYLNRRAASLKLLQNVLNKLFKQQGIENIEWSKYTEYMPSIRQKEIFNLKEQNFIPEELMKKLTVEINGKEYAMYSDALAAEIKDLQQRSEKEGARGVPGDRGEIKDHSHFLDSEFFGPSPTEAEDEELSSVHIPARPGELIFYGLEQGMRDGMSYMVYREESGLEGLSSRKEGPLNNPKILELEKKLKDDLQASRDRDVGAPAAPASSTVTAQKDGGNMIKYLGGDQKGGDTTAIFTGVVWITAGAYSYKVWVALRQGERQGVYIQRYLKNEPAGQERVYDVSKEVRVGRLEEDNDYYFFPEESGLVDPSLSRNHFSVKVFENASQELVIRVVDRNSTLGTTVNWQEPAEVMDAKNTLEDYKKALVEPGSYQQGAVVDLRQVPGTTMVGLVGDLHAREDNLNAILEHQVGDKGTVRELLAQMKLILVFLGDAVHGEDDVVEMSSSVNIMKTIMDLKISHPNQVYYLLGNHDYLDSPVTKGRMPQALIYAEHLKNSFGSEYIDQYKEFIAQSPLEVTGNGFVATHAGPIRGMTPEQLKTADVSHWDSPFVKEATDARMSQGEFNLRDVKNSLAAAGQPMGIYFVGHTPARDDDQWHWDKSADGVKHVVIFAAKDNFGFTLMTNGQESYEDVSVNGNPAAPDAKKDGGMLENILIKLPRQQLLKLNEMVRNSKGIADKMGSEITMHFIGPRGEKKDISLIFSSDGTVMINGVLFRGGVNEQNKRFSDQSVVVSSAGRQEIIKEPVISGIIWYLQKQPEFVYGEGFSGYKVQDIWERLKSKLEQLSLEFHFSIAQDPSTGALEVVARPAKYSLTVNLQQGSMGESVTPNAPTLPNSIVDGHFHPIIFPAKTGSNVPSLADLLNKIVPDAEKAGQDIVHTIITQEKARLNGYIDADESLVQTSLTGYTIHFSKLQEIKDAANKLYDDYKKNLIPDLEAAIKAEILEPKNGFFEIEKFKLDSRGNIQKARDGGADAFEGIRELIEGDLEQKDSAWKGPRKNLRQLVATFKEYGQNAIGKTLRDYRFLEIAFGKGKITASLLSEINNSPKNKLDAVHLNKLLEKLKAEFNATKKGNISLKSEIWIPTEVGQSEQVDDYVITTQPDVLQEVLKELVRNAYKYSWPTDDMDKNTQKTITLKIAVDEKSHKAEFSVIDEGIGVDDPQLFWGAQDDAAGIALRGARRNDSGIGLTVWFKMPISGRPQLSPSEWNKIAPKLRESIRHTLRNIILPVQGYADLFKEFISQQAPNEEADKLSRLTKDLMHVYTRIGQLLDADANDSRADIADKDASAAAKIKYSGKAGLPLIKFFIDTVLNNPPKIGKVEFNNRKGAIGRLEMTSKDGDHIADVLVLDTQYLSSSNFKKMLFVQLVDSGDQRVSRFIEENFNAVMHEIAKIGTYAVLTGPIDHEKILADHQKESIEDLLNSVVVVVNDRLVSVNGEGNILVLDRQEDIVRNLNMVKYYERDVANGFIKYSGNFKRNEVGNNLKNIERYLRVRMRIEQKAWEQAHKPASVVKRDQSGQQTLDSPHFNKIDQQKDGGTATDKGGIDLRALPIVTNPMETLAASNSLNAPVVIDPKIAEALNRQWLDIQKQMQQGPMPYKQMKEFVACCNKEQASEQINQVFACIANILRLEEDAAVSTPPELKEILTTIG